MEYIAHLPELNRQRLDRHEKTLDVISSDLTTVRKDLDAIRTVWDVAEKSHERNHSLLRSLVGIAIIGVLSFVGQIIMSARWAATTDGMLLHMSQSQARLEAVAQDHERRLRVEEISPH